jgi:AraC-like DNA-binding protein
MTTFRPHPALRDRVSAIDIVETDGGDATVLPSTSAVLGIQFRGRVRSGASLLSPAGITGIQPSAQTYSYAGGTGSILVRFTPQGAACLGVPASELASRSVPLDAILAGAGVSEMLERLGEASSAAVRVAVVERWLGELPYAEDPVVGRGLALLVTATDDPTIAAVARELGMSERQLERRFLAQVGVTPKRFATLHRFERAIALAATAPSLTTAAVEAGYYDQSHFIRDCQRFAGAAPGKFIGRR